jgi:hypothetical protein
MILTSHARDNTVCDTSVLVPPRNKPYRNRDERR